MLVGERMTPNPITTTPNTPVPDALDLMRSKKIRRLPVLDRHGRLVGIVTEKDLLYASPSPVTSLSAWELTYLLSKLTVDKVMTRDVITVTEDTPLEEAARILADNKIGSLPVMRDGQLVGIITETDISKVTLELLGAREPGIRLTALIPDTKGTLAKIAGAIADIGGNIVALGTSALVDSEHRLMMVKVADVTPEALADVLQDIVVKVMDVREA
ncbi:MAG TPA: CBS domain-containing protein [Anaerolineae bacterium]|nr:CBS domain-containing protein [Anaerolineae bacterium]HIQ04301.1 CBS domain-containing protein [Anaerolineae bacterium]